MTEKEIMDLRIRAAKAMGWEEADSIWDEETDFNMRGRVGVFKICTTCVITADSKFAPDLDLNQAMMLATKLHGKFDTPEKYIDLNLDSDGWSATICYGAGDYDFALVTADTPAVALTLAALKAAEGSKK